MGRITSKVVRLSFTKENKINEKAIFSKAINGARLI